jgi:hypothetical protein
MSHLALNIATLVPARRLDLSGSSLPRAAAPAKAGAGQPVLDATGADDLVTLTQAAILNQSGTTALGKAPPPPERILDLLQ